VIKLDWTIFLQFVNFLVLMIALNALLYRPLRRVLAQRRGTIEEGHARARDLRGQIDEKMAAYQQQLQEAKQKGAQEKAELRKQAGRQEADILGAAHQEASDHVQKIKSQVAAEAADAQTTLKKETDALAGMIAAKVLGRTL